MVQEAVFLQLVGSKLLALSISIVLSCIIVVFEKSGERRDRGCTKATPPFMQALRDLDTLLKVKVRGGCLTYQLEDFGLDDSRV